MDGREALLQDPAEPLSASPECSLHVSTRNSRLIASWLYDQTVPSTHSLKALFEVWNCDSLLCERRFLLSRETAEPTSYIMWLGMFDNGLVVLKRMLSSGETVL